MIPLTPRSSTNVAASGYCPATNVLAVRFHGSDLVHHFKDVPADVATAMDEAPSVGSFFARNVRDKFPHEVIDGSTESTT